MQRTRFSRTRSASVPVCWCVSDAHAPADRHKSSPKTNLLYQLAGSVVYCIRRSTEWNLQDYLQSCSYYRTQRKTQRVNIYHNLCQENILYKLEHTVGCSLYAWNYGNYRCWIIPLFSWLYVNVFTYNIVNLNQRSSWLKNTAVQPFSCHHAKTCTQLSICPWFSLASVIRLSKSSWNAVLCSQLSLEPQHLW